MNTTIITIIGILLTMCGYSNTINISEILLPANTTEISTNTSISQTNYTQEVSKDNIIKALNNIDLDYLFSLKNEQLINNIEKSFSDEGYTLIYPDKKFQKIFLREYNCDFYFDESGNVISIDFVDSEKILKTEKSNKNFDAIQNILGKNQAYSIKTNVKYFTYDIWEAIMIYDIDKYSYIFHSQDVDGKFCNVLICKTEDKKLGEISKIEREFRSDLPDIIISKKDEIFSFFENYSPDGYKIIDNYNIIAATEGDLNNDGRNDFVVVAQQENSYMLEGDKLRWTYVFEQNNTGNYNLSHMNKSLVLAGLGENFAEISIKDGILSIEDYGVSAENLGHIYNFSYDNNDFILKKYIRMDSAIDSREEYIYDFENLIGTLNLHIENMPPENEKILKMLQFPLDNEKIYFDSFVSDKMFLKDFHLPVFGGNTFYPDFPEFKISTQEALDNIKNLYYSDMEKVYIPWTEETKKNYSQALGYEALDYYYKNNNGTLSYRQIQYVNKNLDHAVIYTEEEDTTNFKLYYVSDNTGTVSIPD